MTRKFYKAGLFTQLLLLLGHLYTNRNGLPIPAVDAPSRLLIRLMQTYEIQYSVGKHTLDETIRGYDFTWAAFVVFTFLASLSVLRFSYRNPRTGRYLAGVNTLIWGVCLITALIYWSLPQQVLFGMLTLCFGLSYALEWNTPTPNNTRVCVVGAGLGGLTAAYQLQKQGYTQITVLEKADRVGGKCASMLTNGHVYDLGGHEMLAGYADLIAIADELDAPHQRSIETLVYDRDTRKYLNFKQSASVNKEYSSWQVLVATVRYIGLVMFTFRRFSSPGTGYANMPQELAMPLQGWLKKRRLEALSDILKFVIKIQGYGQFKETSAAHLVKFMGPANWTSLVLSGMGLWKKWPRIFTYGAYNVCERMAATLPDVRLNTDIRSIERTDAPTGGIRVYIGQEQEPLVYDQLILSVPLSLPQLGFLSLSEKERLVFSQIKQFRFISTLAHTEGLPAGVVGTIPENNIAIGQYTGYIRDYADAPVSLFFTLAEPGITGKLAETEINKVLDEVPAHNGEKPAVKAFLRQKEWPYFLHFGHQQAAEGLYDQLESLQGKNHTYYASSALSFECMGNTVAYAKRLIQTRF